MKTVVSFLGTGHYEETQYALDGQTYASRYCQVAIAKLLGFDQLRVLSTPFAFDKHGQSLKAECEKHALALELINIPNGQNEGELWQIFDKLRLALVGEDVAFDITHGFRAQSFFGGAVSQYLMALEQLPEQFQVLYAEWQKDAEFSPVWRLDTFVELLRWAEALGDFFSSGTGEPLRGIAEQARRRAAKAAHVAGERSSLHTLTKALIEFSEAIESVRTPQILSSAPYKDQKAKQTRPSHTQSVLEAIELCADEVKQQMPALQPLLERLKRLLNPLQCERLYDAQGLAAQHALARQYLHWGRLAEASIVMREAYVSHYAKDTDEISLEARRRAENAFHHCDTNTLSGIATERNDLQHGGWSSNARKAAGLRKGVERWIERLADYQSQAAPEVPSGRILLVSRHSGAIEWLTRQGIQADEQHQHLDINDIRQGDTVIGTLPIHLAAQVCAKGASFQYLQIDIPEPLRGQELSADQLDDLGARLQCFSVRAVKDD